MVYLRLEIKNFFFIKWNVDEKVSVRFFLDLVFFEVVIGREGKIKKGCK